MDVWKKGVITNVLTRKSENSGIFESIEVYVGNERYFKNFLINHPNDKIAKNHIYYLEKLCNKANIYTLGKKVETRELVNLEVLVTTDCRNGFMNINKIKIKK